MKIDKPGIYRNIDVASYHADPCPTPSLSQSIAKVLIDQSPLHAFIAHPRLHPAEVGDEAEKYAKAKAIGDATHALLIERGKALAVAPFDSWRSGASQAFRDKANAEGKTPILEDHFNQAHEIMRAAIAQIDAHEESDCFKNGAGEVALIWQEGKLWFRCLVDWLHDGNLTVDDLKTSGMSVAPHVIGLRAAEAGYDIQCAMFERGLDVLDPKNAGRRKYRFVMIEQDQPYALNVMVMGEQWLTMGRKKLQHAVDIWSRCMAYDKWPGYPPYAITPEYPSWQESKWLAREIHEEAENRKPMLTSIAGG
jgi:hypothetical protein